MGSSKINAGESMLEPVDLTTIADWPVFCCPPKTVDNIDLHPRVYFTGRKGQAKCPYCGLVY